MKKTISIVIPVYNSENTIDILISEINLLTKNYKIKLILVDDGSRDKSWKKICILSKKYNYILGIQHTRNFGQHNAVLTGMRYATGNYCVAMDDDLQNPPKEIIKLINYLESNDSDVVYGKYDKKKHSLLRNIGTWINNLMANTLISKPDNVDITSFFALRSYLLPSITDFNGPYPYLPGLVLRTTNRVNSILVHHAPRKIGQSNYTLRSLFKLWLYGFLSFSIRPIQIMTYMGLCIFFLCTIYIVITIIRRFFNPDVPLGWTTIIAINTGFGGLNIMFLGFIGEYIGRMFLTVNKKPQSVVRTTIGQFNSRNNLF